MGGGKVLPKTAKIKAITEFPIPTNKRELRRFLGMAGFYRKFCPNFAQIAIPLTNLLSEKVRFSWSEASQRAFENLKTILSSKPILVAPSYKKPFKIAVDASDSGVGGVLLQEDAQGLEHPVGYFSKKLTASQRSYSTIEKEALSMILAIEHFEVYVNGPFPIVVYTDHNPLVYIDKFKHKNSRLMRWSIYLQSYNLDIVHIPGKNNIMADALSRM